MTDIYDIKILVFWWITSTDHMILVVIFIFLFLFFILLGVYFFQNEPKKVIQQETPVDDLVKRKQFIKENIEDFSRSIFYREVGILLRFLVLRKYKNYEIFTLTLEELLKKYPSKYDGLIKEVYFLEFNDSLEESIKKRKQIVEQIEV